MPEEGLVDVFELGDVGALLNRLADILDDVNQLRDRLVVLLDGVRALVPLHGLILSNINRSTVLDFEHSRYCHFIENAVDLTEAWSKCGFAVEELVDQALTCGSVATVPNIPAPELVDLAD
jgi:hypothetical protein